MSSKRKKKKAAAKAQSDSDLKEFVKKEKLQICYEFIKDEIEPRHFMDRMVTKGALTSDDEDLINNTQPPTRKTRAEKLLEIVWNGKPNISMYDIFVEALKENYPWVVKKLEEIQVDEKSILKKMKQTEKKKTETVYTEGEHQIMEVFKDILTNTDAKQLLADNMSLIGQAQKFLNIKDGSQNYTDNDKLIALVTSIINPTESSKEKEMKLAALQTRLERLFSDTQGKKTTFKDVYGKSLEHVIKQNTDNFDLIKKKGELVVKLKVPKTKTQSRKSSKEQGLTSKSFGRSENMCVPEKHVVDKTAIAPVASGFNEESSTDNQREWTDVAPKRKEKAACFDPVVQKNEQQTPKILIEHFLRQKESSCLRFYADDKMYEDNEYKFMQDVVSLWNVASRDKSYIVLGVMCQSNMPHRVTGIQVSKDNDFYQRLFNSEYFTSKPLYKYNEYVYDKKLVGIITVYSSKGCGSPSVVKISSPQSEIVKGHLWASYDKENKVVPQDDDLTREIYQWFNSEETYSLPANDNKSVKTCREMTNAPSGHTTETHGNTTEFASAVDHFRKGHFVLISGKSLKKSTRLESFALVPWIAVYDFDKYTRDNGLLCYVEDSIKSKRSLHVLTWKNDAIDVTEHGTQWWCLRGLRGNADCETPDNPVTWIKTTKKALKAVSSSLGRFCEVYTVLKIVILWPPEDAEAEYMSKFLDHLVEYLYSYKLIIICFEEPKTDISKPLLTMLIKNHNDTVRINIPQDDFCHEIENLLESKEPEKHTNHTLPKNEACTDSYIDKTDAAWLLEDMDVLFELNPYTKSISDIDILKKEKENFYHGGTIRWSTWYEIGSGLEIERDMMNKMKEHIKKCVKNLKTVTVTLYHAPGGGGTTMSQRILWDLHKIIPCVEVKKDAHVEGLIDRITFIYNKTLLPALVLLDGEDQVKVDQLNTGLKSVHSVLLYVKRYTGPMQEPNYNLDENKFWLNGKVSECEANKLALKFQDQCDDEAKKKNLAKLSREVREKQISHYVFEFGMTTYYAEYKGIASFVRGYLCLGKYPEMDLLPWQKILVYLSLVYYYGQASVPYQFFGQLLNKPSNYVIDMDDFQHPLYLFVVPSSNNCRTNEIRICHYLVAKEILEYVLNPLNNGLQESDLSKTAKRGLKKLCLEFIDYAGHRKLKSLTATTIIHILTQTFINRNNKNTGEGEIQNRKKPPFSKVVTDVDQDKPFTGRLEVLRKLTTSFPEDPNFQAHLGRFYACCRPEEEDKAEACFEDALKLCEQQNLGKEINDIEYSMRLTLMRVYHMYGTIFKRRVSKFTGRTPWDKAQVNIDDSQFLSTAENLTTAAEKACKYFGLSRKYKPLGHGETTDYSYSSEIMVRVHICDFVRKHQGQNGITKFIKVNNDHPAAKFIIKSVYAIEDLMVEFYNTVDPDNIDQEYQRAIFCYHCLFKKETSKLKSQLSPTDAYYRRLTIAAVKLKYLDDCCGTYSVLEKTISEDDITQLVALYEGNFAEAEKSSEINERQLDGDYKEWLLAIRNPAFHESYTVEKVLTHVRTWNYFVSSPSSRFYLFICTSLIGFGTRFQKGFHGFLEEAQRIQRMNKSICRPHYPREWLGKNDKDIKCLLTNNRIGHVEDRHIKHSSELAVCKGTICSPNKKPQSGYINLDLGKNSFPVKVFFIPLKAKLEGSRYAGERVQFHLAFTLYHGYEAFTVKRLKKYICRACENKTEITMDKKWITCRCGERVVKDEK